MKELVKIRLTGTLRTYKAIVVNPGQEVPDDYFEVAGYYGKGGNYVIAIPEELMDQKDLRRRLSDQAWDCLIVKIDELLPR